MDNTPDTHSLAKDNLTAEQHIFISRFSIGALFFPQGYFFATNLVRDGFLLFVPLYNIYVWLRGAFQGRKRSWDTGEWKSYELYEKRQKTMDKAGLIIFAILVAYFIFLFMIFALLASLIPDEPTMDRPYDSYHSYDSSDCYEGDCDGEAGDGVTPTSTIPYPAVQSQ